MKWHIAQPAFLEDWLQSKQFWVLKLAGNLYCPVTSYMPKHQEKLDFHIGVFFCIKLQPCDWMLRYLHWYSSCGCMNTHLKKWYCIFSNSNYYLLKFFVTWWTGKNLETRFPKDAFSSQPIRMDFCQLLPFLCAACISWVMNVQWAFSWQSVGNWACYS